MSLRTGSKLALAAFLTVGSTVATAGPLYKCIDAKGVAAYQQTPCPKESKLVGKGYVPPVAPSPQLGWAAQSRSLASQQRTREALYEAERPRRQTSAPGGLTSDEREQMRSLDNQISALGTLNSRGKRELAADLSRMKSQIATGSEVTGAPARSPDPPPNVQRSDLGLTKIDQFGNPYTKVAPNVLIDQKTGKPCITNGAGLIISCE